MKPSREIPLTRRLFSDSSEASNNAFEPDWALDAIELLKHGLVVIDAKGIVRKVNLGASELLGFAPTDMIGKSCMLVAPPEIQVDGDRFLAGLLRQSEKIKSHWVMRHRNGSYITVTARFKTEHSPEFGTSVLIVFAIDDKTDPLELARRAQSERDASHMAMSYGMLQQVINSIPARIAYLDCKSFECIFGNEAFALGNGKHIKAITGKTLQNLLPSTDWALVQPHYELAAKGHPAKFDHTEIDSSGTTRHFQCDLLPHFSRSGAQIGIFSLCVDITTHHQIELALRDSEARLHTALQAEKELSDLKTAFVSMASHELRTPLTNIQTSADLLWHYLDKLSVDDRRNSIKDIQDAVTRMRLVMENVLVLGKLGSIAPTYQPRHTVVNALMKQLIEEVDSADGRAHSITLQTPAGGETLHAQMDESLIRQIVGNLISNACKYSPAGSTIKVCWCCVERPETQSRGETSSELKAYELRLEVRDQGIGIPLDDIPKLFDNFHRASNVGQIPGTGLGLSIVKRALDSLGGRIEVVSTPGTGSCFIAHLPWITQ